MPRTVMATRRELQKLACLRLKEAEALFEAGCYDGCAYLCGYVVELALKAAVCANLAVVTYPEKRLEGAFRTHVLEDLKLVAGMDDAFIGNNALLANWSVAVKWKPERRYEPEGTYTSTTSREVLEAVRAYPDGVLACISSRW
jgi:HEPN domain-containing protein